MASVDVGPGDALLLVDLHQGRLPCCACPAADVRHLLGAVNACLDLFGVCGLPVFAARHWHVQEMGPDGAGCIPACEPEGVAGPVAARLRLPAHCAVIDRGRHAVADSRCAFTHSELDLQLDALGITRLFIAGASAGDGVLHDAADALGWGYHVVLVHDAVIIGDVPPGHAALALAAMAQAGARIMHSRDLRAIGTVSVPVSGAGAD